MIRQPIDEVLKNTRHVLVAGAGGGFDIVAGMAVVLGLEAAGKKVTLANASFTSLNAIQQGRALSHGTVWVDAASSGPSYFPEAALARWRRSRNEPDGVYCLPMVGGKPFCEAFHEIVAETGVDTIFLVDGGVDALFRGDERSLGTPTLDALSVLAAHTSGVPALLATVAFGAERHDGIAHGDALARIADMTRIGAFLGSESIVSTTPIGAALLECARYVQDAHEPLRHSIVVDTLCAAIRGEFGSRPVNVRTVQTPIWVSPLAAMAFYFQLAPIAESKMYLKALAATTTMFEANAVVEGFRKMIQIGPGEPIPI